MITSEAPTGPEALPALIANLEKRPGTAPRRTAIEARLAEGLGATSFLAALNRSDL